MKVIKDMYCTERSPTRHAGTIVLLSHALSSAFFFTTTAFSQQQYYQESIFATSLSKRAYSQQKRFLQHLYNIGS